MDFLSTYVLNYIQGPQISGQQLALGNQRLPVRERLLAICRGELSAVIAGLKGAEGAEATCVEIATAMKNCFRLKDRFNFNIT